MGNRDYEMRNLRALPLKIGVPAYFRCFDFCLRQKTYNTQILFGPKNKAYVQFH